MNTQVSLLKTLILIMLGCLVAPTGLGAGATLVPAGATWKYLDTGVDPGTAWRSPGSNDNTWASGPAQLGYGDLDEATVVGFGPDPSAKYVTAYFRHSFLVTNAPAYTNVTLRLLCDGGAVVYLNGIEIGRVRLPYGAIGYQTLASEAAIEGRLFTAAAVHQDFPGEQCAYLVALPFDWLPAGGGAFANWG